MKFHPQATLIGDFPHLKQLIYLYLLFHEGYSFRLAEVRDYYNQNEVALRLILKIPLKPIEIKQLFKKMLKLEVHIILISIFDYLA